MLKITSCLLSLPVGLLLSVSGAEAKDKDKTAMAKEKPLQTSSKSTDKGPEDKHLKRATEGHRPQDLNGDGIITRNEWPGNDQSFKQLDEDGDGSLTNKDRGWGAQGGEKRMYERPVNDYRTRKAK
ncbi:MAG TPA: hypothetical protein VER03_18075 [Bryobacteraceae bacterium]|nr:hypothetical protein [Bryobacteraceae bacterium]